MGKKRHFKGNNRSEDKKRRREVEEKWRNNPRGQHTLTMCTENARFETFYKAMHFTHSNEDWERFLHHLREPLPACFRINSDFAFADELRKQLLGFAGQKVVINDTEIAACQEMSWYPNRCAYKLGTDRKSIRKLDGLNDLHEWMKQHTENGNITRQEAVSMVPPLALNVQSHHKCLDMCAAPGSKTSQLLEIVLPSMTNPPEQQGLVVANDVDTDRAYMLVHQCKRLNSPQLVITTHSGQEFPTIGRNKGEFFDRVLCDVPCSGDGTMRKNPMIWARWGVSSSVTLHPLQLMIAQRGIQLLKPGGLMVYSTCSMSPYEDEAVVSELLRSSNGTLELVDAREFLPLFKARAGLTHWHVLDDYHVARKEAVASQREKKEEKQAARASVLAEKKSTAEEDGEVKEMTAIVGEANSSNVANYSNSVGDDNGNADDDNADDAPDGEIGNDVERDGTDAVADDKPQDEMEVLDQAQEERERKVQQSLSLENLPDDPELKACVEMGMNYYRDYEAVPEHLRKKTRLSLFPPTKEELEWMKLEKCLRCLPQDEDTGGFFVATLRKKGKEPVGEPASIKEEQQSESSGKHSYRKGLVDYVPWEKEACEQIREFYGMTDALPPESFYLREDYGGGNRGSRTSVSSKNIYFLPHPIRTLLQGDHTQRLKIVTAGVKLFEKKVTQSGAIDYRLLHDGLPHVAPYITKRKVQVPIQDFCNLLGGGLVSFSTLSAGTIEALEQQVHGVVILEYVHDPKDRVTSVDGYDTTAVKGEEKCAYRYYLVGWKGHSRTVNVMCGKVELEAMKHQLEALKVLRPKIVSLNKPFEAAGAAIASAPSTIKPAFDSEAGEVDETAQSSVEDAVKAENVAVEE